MKLPEYIAVYGTLRRGFRAEDLMKPCKLVGDTKIVGAMFDLGSFPGVKLDLKDHRFYAEVYRIPTKPADRAKLLERLDTYEGEGFLYIRRNIETKFGSTYIYEYKGDIVGREPFFKWA